LRFFEPVEIYPSNGGGHVKKMWWGIFFSSLVLVLIAFPESIFAYRLKDLAVALVLSLIPLIPLVAPFVPGAIQTFINEKIKGLANKHDIEQLTQKVEEARLFYQKGLEDHKTDNRLRLSVLERRFQAHQEAYRLCYVIINDSAENTKQNYQSICDWWPGNCLYLDPKPRECVLEAVFGAFLIVNWNTDGRTDYDDEGYREALRETSRGINLIHAALQSLEEAVGVPPIAGSKVDQMRKSGLIKEPG
jgi:hypothetical protein